MKAETGRLHVAELVPTTPSSAVAKLATWQHSTHQRNSVPSSTAVHDISTKISTKISTRPHHSVRGQRSGALPVSGRTAQRVPCHRRSACRPGPAPPCGTGPSAP
eukprot:3059533-Rhodomonas_salina.1